MGRAQTITITPSGVSKSGQVSTGAAAAQGGLVQSPPPSVAGDRIGASNGSFGQLNEYSQAHELRGSVASGNLSVTATWGADGTPVTSYLRGMHREGQSQSGWPVSSSRTTTSGSVTGWGSTTDTSWGSSAPSSSNTAGSSNTASSSNTSPSSTPSSSSTTKTKTPT